MHEIVYEMNYSFECCHFVENVARKLISTDRKCCCDGFLFFVNYNVPVFVLFHIQKMTKTDIYYCHRRNICAIYSSFVCVCVC